MEEMQREGYEAEGFLFMTKTEAEAATKERKQIEYIESKLDYTNPEKVKNVYEKAATDKLFKTPVGMLYMKHLQKFLKGKYPAEEIGAVPVTSNRYLRPSQTTEEGKATRKKSLTLSYFLNVVLAIAVLFMFYVALSSDKPNILNYERALQNKYASWEQELTQREQVVREKELELKIQMP